MEDCARLPTRLLPAQLLAVEVLLADPEALGNDALEGDLYILRDQLRTATSAQPTVPLTPHSETQDSNPEQ
jgi:hypothetical protein